MKKIENLKRTALSKQEGEKTIAGGGFRILKTACCEMSESAFMDNTLNSNYDRASDWIYFQMYLNCVY